jgi:uncharacterized protein (DUF934 family)
MALIRDGKAIEDRFTLVTAEADWTESDGLLVDLALWQSQRDALLASGRPLGLKLGSDEHPDTVIADIEHFASIALEFPVFRDGRAYSYARLLRRAGYTGELRAVGDVLLDQLHYMQRVGFDAFEIDAEDPEAAYKQAQSEFSVWYQPAGDERPWASRLRSASG